MFINEKQKEINFKIVYYGPPRSGKSTTLRAIYDQMRSGKSGDTPLTLNQGEDHTLYFDFVPLSVGKLSGYDVRLHLYTVPGEVGYHMGRLLTSRGLDGVVFVADSRLTQMEANLAALSGLRDILKKEGFDAQVPMAWQFNKRDLPDALSMDQLTAALNIPAGSACFETVASKGHGVMEPMLAAAKAAMQSAKSSSAMK